MNRDERIKIAVSHLEKNGYTDIEKNPTRGVDILAYFHSCTDEAVFIAVMPPKGKYFPMHPFESESGYLRYVSIKEGAARWMEAHKWTGAYRIDAIMVKEKNGVYMIDHFRNAAFNTIES